MEKGDIVEAEDELALPPPPALTVAIAVNGNRNNKYVVKWALEKFVPEGNVVFKLLHVRAMITAVPTPMGNSIPLSQVLDDVAAAYKKVVEWQTSQMLLPYRKMCAQKKVQVDVIVNESDDVANAIAEEVAKCTINKLVIGSASRGMFSRKLNKHNMSSRISVCTPSFCTVYAVSKGKLSSICPSDSESNLSIKGDSSDTSSANSSSSFTASSRTEFGSVASYSHFHSPSLPMQRFQALSTINQTILHTRASSIETNHSKCRSLDIKERKDAMNSCSSSSEIGNAVSRTSSYRSLPTDNQSCISDQPSISDVLADYSSFESQVVTPQAVPPLLIVVPPSVQVPSPSVAQISRLETVEEDQEAKMDMFFEELSSELLDPDSPTISAFAPSTSAAQPLRPSRQQIKDALYQVQEYLSAIPDSRTESESLMTALDVLTSLNENSGITVGQKSDLLDMALRLKTLPSEFTVAVKAKEDYVQHETAKVRVSRQLQEDAQAFKTYKAERDKLNSLIADLEAQLKDLDIKLKQTVSAKEKVKAQIDATYERAAKGKAEKANLEKQTGNLLKTAKEAELQEKTLREETRKMEDLISKLNNFLFEIKSDLTDNKRSFVIQALGFLKQ